MKILRAYKFSLLLLLLFSTSGCDGLTEISNEDVVYEVGNSNPEDIEILLHRLQRFPVSLFSSIDFDQETRELIFKRGAPDKELIHFMANRTGLFSIYSETNPSVKLTNRYVVNASAAARDGRIFIQLYLSDEGGELLHNITKANIGKKVIVELEGVIIMAPIVRDALGKSFETTFEGSAGEAKRVAALIEGGSLSKPIQLEKIVK